MYYFVMKWFPQTGQYQLNLGDYPCEKRNLRQCIVKRVESCSIKRENHGNTILFWFLVEDINSSDIFYKIQNIN